MAMDQKKTLITLNLKCFLSFAKCLLNHVKPAIPEKAISYKREIHLEKVQM